MRFGVVVPGHEPYHTPEYLRTVAEAADKHGIDVALIWDHYNLPWSNSTVDAWVALSYMASITENILLGTCVTPIPFRPPAQLAKIVSSLDNLSGGRVVLGVGAGWHRPEFEGYSRWRGDSERVSMTLEAVNLMTRLWTEGKVTFKGKYYQTRSTVLEPKPVQKPYPQMWWGTTGKRMLNAAARYGTGWIPTTITPSHYKRLRRQLNHLLENHHRKEFTYAYADFETRKNERELSETIEEFKDAGCQLYAMTWRFTAGESRERIRWFSDIVSSFR